MTTATDDLVARAEISVETHDATLTASPSRRVVIVTCMDARIDPHRIFGIDLGEAHVVRNAGGVVTEDVVRSVAVSQQRLGTVEVLLIHHTDCGLLGVTDEEFASGLEAETGQRPPWSALAFADLEADVRDSIARIRRDPFLCRTQSVRGFVYDVVTGRLHEVAG